MKSKSSVPELRVQFLGNFIVECGSRRLSNTSSRQRKLWSLLGYFLAHRNIDISLDRLSTVLWQEDNTDNPAGALKNLVYRLRNMLEELKPDFSIEFIVYKNGNYSWNNEIPCKVDTEEFELACKKATLPNVAEEDRIEYLSEAIEIYKGEFLNSMSMEEWVIPRAAYYHSMYVDCVCRVGQHYYDKKMFDKVNILCSKSISLYPFEEQIQLMKLYALIEEGRVQEALGHYEYITALYYKELGVQPSLELKEAYKEILSRTKDKEAGISELKSELEKNEAQSGGAFVCNFEVFRNMYQLETRSIERTGQSIYLCLFTLDSKGKFEENAQREDIMELLNESLHASLRRGDIISRFSVTQYVIMLPSITYENCQIAIQRIEEHFRKNCNNKSIKLKHEMIPIESDRKF